MTLLDLLTPFQWWCLALGSVTVFWMVGAYNRLMALRNTINQAAVQIDESLRRRSELIEGLMQHLREPLDAREPHALDAIDQDMGNLHTAIAAFNARPLHPQTVAALNRSFTQLQSSLPRLLALVSYDPALQQIPEVPPLVGELKEIERRLRFGRQVYNDGVAAYNAALLQWPTRLLRRPFGLDEAATL
jgi:LemA protein